MSYPPTFTISNINELFNLVNSENIDRVVLDLNHMLYVISKLKNNPDLGAKFILPDSFTWVDDQNVNTEINFTLSINQGPTPR